MNVLITGVSKGLGLETTKVLLNQGHKVYGISRTQTSDIIQLQKIFDQSLFLLQFDLENSNELSRIIFNEFIGKETVIDVFINNAAYAYDDIITNVNLTNLEKMFKVNLLTPIMLTKLIIRKMILKRVKGVIIHISSISVHTGYKGLSMYAASKGALEAFSKNTAREWGEQGIRSNTIVVGFMDTEMSSSLSKEQKSRIYNRTSLKQQVDPISVAETISFLISDKAKSITGQNIFVDSGTI